MQPLVLIDELALGRHRERVVRSLQAYATTRGTCAASESRQGCPLSAIAGWIASRRRPAVLAGLLAQ
jgi:hypothetical protein